MILTSGGGYLLSFALDLRHGAATPPEVFSLRKALTVATYLHALLDRLRIHYDDLPLVTRKNEESATIFMIGGLALGGLATDTLFMGVRALLLSFATGAVRGLTYGFHPYAGGMKRFEILFPVRMLDWLRKEADRRGVAICEVIRSIIQVAMDKK